RLSINTRLLVGFAALLLLTLAMGVFALRTISGLSLLVEETSRPMQVLDEAMQAKAAVIDMRSQVRALALSTTPDDTAKAIAAMARDEHEVRSHLNAIVDHYPGDPAELTEALQALDARSELREQLVSMVREGQKE